MENLTKKAGLPGCRFHLDASGIIASDSTILAIAGPVSRRMFGTIQSRQDGSKAEATEALAVNRAFA